jgi:hypothetical protein
MPQDILLKTMVNRHIKPHDVPSVGQLEYAETINKALRSNGPKQSVDVYGDAVDVPIAPGFTNKTTNVVGSPELGKAVEKLFTLVPALRGLAPSVIANPTTDSFGEIDRSNRKTIKDLNGTIFDPYTDFPRLNLLGITNTKTKNITINPRLDSDELTRAIVGDRPYERRLELLDTLGHEFSHVAGYDEDKAYPLGDRYINKPKDK